MTYTPTIWEDLPSTDTAINADRLNNMESGIAGALPVFNVRQRGAAGDGVTNDTVAIQAAIDSLPATGGTVYFPAGVYVVNGTLTLTDRENVTLVGEGASQSIYWSGPTKGTVLKRASGTGTMLDWSASTAAQSLRGCRIEGIAFDGNNLAATVVKLASLYGGIFRDLHIREGTSVGLSLLTVNLSGVEDLQACMFQNITVACISTASAKGITMDSHTDGGGNVSMCSFDNILVYTQNGTGIEMADTDTNTLTRVTVNRSGSALGVDLIGSNHASSGHARHNAFLHIDAVGGVTSRGTGTYSLPAQKNLVLYSSGNLQPEPTIETGSTLYWLSTAGVACLGELRFPRGTYATGIDFYGGGLATFSSVMQFPNNKSVYSRNAANSAFVELFRCNVLDELQVFSPSRFSGTTTFDGQLAWNDGINLVVGTTNGTKIGTSTSQKLGFYNKAPVAQPSSTGETSGFTAGAGTAVNDASTFTGNVGSTAYRISDIVKHLKNLGLIAS